MRREYWIGGIFFVLFLTFMIVITWVGGKPIPPSSTVADASRLTPTPEPIPSPTAIPFVFDEQISWVTEPVSDQSITFAAQSADVGSATDETYWIAGYCKGEDGTLLSQAEVVVYIVNPDEKNYWAMDEWNIETAKTTTDANGYYTIPLKGPNQYEIRATPKEKYLSVWEKFTLTPSQPNLAKHFVHPLAPFTVRGKVIDAQTQAPIAGAEVLLMPRMSDNHPKQNIEKTVTGSDGRFLIPRIAKGTFTFLARANGYLDHRPYYPTTDSDHPLNTVSVDQSTQHKEYTIEMEPGGSAVFQVVDGDGQSISQATISITQDQVDAWYVCTKTTDAGGRAESGELPFARLTAKASHKEHGTAYSKPFQPGTKGNPTQVTLTLNGSATVSGHVTSAKGLPVPGREVLSRYLSIDEWNRILEEKVKTDTEGFYSFNKLSAGQYQFTIADYLTRELYAQKRTVTLKDGDNLTIDFQMGETRELRGKVVSKTEMEPVSEVSVRAVVYLNSNIEGVEADETDENGEFVIPFAPKGDDIQFQLHAKGYSHTIHHRAMDNSYYTLTLDKAGTVRGVVLTPNNQPVPGAKVWPVRYFSQGGDSMPYNTIFSNNDGSFEFSDLYPMDYRFRASMEGYVESDSAQYTVHQGETIEGVVIQMEEGITIQGLVLDSQGQPLPGASITIYSTISNLSKNSWSSYFMTTEFPIAAVSNSDGTFQVEDFPPEGDRIIVQHENFAPTVYQVVPVMLEQQVHTVRMNRGGSIVGKVLDSSNQPQKSAELHAQNFPENLFRFQAFTDENGEYRIDKVPAVAFQVLKFVQNDTMPGEDYKTISVVDGQEVRCDFGGGEGATVRGTVFKGDEPYPNIAVALDGTIFSNSSSGGIGNYLLSTSDQQGNYIFQAVPEGNYKLLASSKVISHVHDHSCDFSTDLFISADSGEIVQDIYLGIYTITGTVVDADSGQPLNNVSIKPSSGAGVPSVFQLNAISGDDGVFTVQPQNPGSYVFSAIKDGYETKEFEVTIEPDGTSTTYTVSVEMNLIEDDMILIAHLIFDGEPASTSWAHFNSIPQPFSGSLVNSSLPEPGSYRVTGMPEGEIEISVYSYCLGKGRSSLPYRVFMQKDKVTEITMHIFEMQSFAVVLKTPDNQPFQGSVLVEILDLTQPYQTEVRVDNYAQQSEGNYFHSQFPIGPYRVRVSVPGYLPMEFNPDSVAEPAEEGNLRKLTLNLTAAQ